MIFFGWEFKKQIKYPSPTRFQTIAHLSIAKEADYTISGQLTESAIDELMAAGKYGELEELIKNMHES